MTRREEISFIAAASIWLFLLSDFLFGARLHEFLFEPQQIEKSYRIADERLHHTLRPDFKGTGAWGAARYDFCTNDLGMRTSCNAPADARKDESFDIAFIGDSFTEGVGLPYEKTFVGLIANALPGKRIANLGVNSYSPTVYLRKIDGFLEKGISFKEVVVYVDISDIQDEAFYYEEGGRLRNDLLVRKALSPSLANRLPLTAEFARYLWLAFDSLRPQQDETEDPRSEWTFTPGSVHYGSLGVQGAIEKALKNMDALYVLLRSREIPLSVGVYPWPAQLAHDSGPSRQVEIWREFCRTRCKNFFNSFESFEADKEKFGLEKVLKDYFIEGDCHYTAKGNEIIARDFLRQYGH